MNVVAMTTESLRRRLHNTIAMHWWSPQPWWPPVLRWDRLRHITERLGETRGETTPGELEFTIDGVVLGRASREYCDAFSMLVESGVITVEVASGVIRYAP